MAPLSGIEYFISANPILSYAAIFVGTLIEGEGTILFSSIFAGAGYLNWACLAVIAVIGTIVGDILWYGAGKFLKGTRLGCFLDKRYEKQSTWVNSNIITKYHRYAIVSKFMYFTTRPTIFLTGWHNFPFKRFLWITTYSTLVWATTLLLIGYGFHLTIQLIGFKYIIHRIELFAAILFVGIFLVERLLNKVFLKKVRSSV